MKPLSISNNALQVLESRYLLQHDGIMETPEELFQRVAHGVAAAELIWGTKQDAQQWRNTFLK